MMAAVPMAWRGLCVQALNGEGAPRLAAANARPSSLLGGGVTRLSSSDGL